MRRGNNVKTREWKESDKGLVINYEGVGGIYGTIGLLLFSNKWGIFL